MAAEKTSPRDTALWALTLLILAGGVYGFYYFEAQAMTLIRVVGLLAAIGLAATVAAQTAKGREMFGFVREADTERRKVVWPTRQETLQTTALVLVITIIVGIMLFLMDTVFGFLIRRLIGAGGGA